MVRREKKIQKKERKKKQCSATKMSLYENEKERDRKEKEKKDFVHEENSKANSKVKRERVKLQ